MNKLIDALSAALQNGSIHFVERDMLVRFKKSPRLCTPLVIEVGVHTTSLNDVFQVEVGLSMPDQIDFFDAQFSCILALPLPITVGSVEEYARALRKQAQK